MIPRVTGASTERSVSAGEASEKGWQARWGLLSFASGMRANAKWKACRWLFAAAIALTIACNNFDDVPANPCATHTTVQAVSAAPGGGFVPVGTPYFIDVPVGYAYS